MRRVVAPDGLRIQALADRACLEAIVGALRINHGVQQLCFPSALQVHDLWCLQGCCQFYNGVALKITFGSP